MKKVRPLRTKRLLLSPMSGEEMAALICGERDEHLRSAYGQMLALSREHPAEAEWYGLWRMALRDGGSVGHFSFMGPPAEGGVELGCGVDEAYRRQGYAAEALAAAVDWAFEHEDVKAVYAETDRENAASRALLARLGFLPDGEGAEGPRFKKARPAVSWLPLGMCLGAALGTSLGYILDNTGLWLSLGICFGMLAGLLLDSARGKNGGTEDANDL